MSSTHEDLWAKKGMMARMTMIYVKSICWFQECRSWWFQICFPISGHANPRGNGETLCRHWIMFQDTQLRDCQAMCGTFIQKPFGIGSRMYLFDHDWNLVGGLEHFLFFPYIGNNHPNWLIFFRGVETTNQEMDDTHVEGFVLLCYCVSGSVKNHHATYSSALIPDNSSLRRKVHKPLIINTSLNYRAWD